MTIKEIYQNKELPELIKILEKPSDYTKEFRANSYFCNIIDCQSID